MRKSGLLAAASLLAAVSALPTAARAQATQPQAEAYSPQDIIVTAQRRAEKLEDVPISITALSADTLEKSNIVNLRDLQNIAPTFRVSSTGVFMQLAIRGITSTALGPGVENNIAVYVDGFYQPSSTGLGGDLANVDNVQILKGPQGTLYGRNATGGAMLVTTREPTMDQFAFDAAAGYGNLDDFRARAYVSAPLAKGVALGVGGYYRTNDGYVKDISGRDAAPYKNYEIRAKLKMEPTGNLAITFGYNRVFKDDGTTYAYGTLDNLWLGADNPLFGGYPVPPEGPLWTNDVGKASVDQFPIVSTKLDEFTAKVAWDVGPGTVTSYTSYAEEDFHVDVDFDGTKLPHQHYDAWWYRRTFQQAIDFQAGLTDTVDLIVGGQYYHDRSTQIADYFYGSTAFDAAVGGPVMLQASDTTQRTRGLAAYADVTWQAAEGLYLNAGIRYSEDKRSIVSYTTGSQLGADGPLPIIIRAPDGPYPILRAPPDSRKFASWTPRFTARYEFSPGMNVYASYSQGFKSGVYNSTGSDPFVLTNPVRPEKITAYEVGVKGQSGRLYFDTAAFYYDYKDLQVNAVSTFDDDFLGVERTSTLLTNAATAEIWGLEGSLTYRVTERFNLRLAGAYTHARYKSFPRATVTIETTPGRYSPTEQDLSGRRIARAPDWTFNIGADYTFDLGGGALTLAANGAYSSRYAPSSETYDEATGEDLYYQAGYFQANASAEYKLPGDRVSIGAWVNNLTDKQYAIIKAAEGVGSRIILSQPRTYGVKVGYKY